MSNSVQTAVSNGSLTLLDISFNYFDRAHVHVYFDNVEQTLGTTWSWVGSTDKRIQFSPAVSTGVVVKVKRVTPLDSARHVYSSPGNAPFNKATVDENFQQTLYASQEAQEGASLEQLQQDLDAQGNKITDLGDALLDGDAVNLKVLREYLPYGPAAASLAARILAEEQVTARLSAQGTLGGGLLITGFDATGLPDNALLHFAGRDSVGDGGGGVLRYAAGSTATVDGVKVFSAVGGRLLRENYVALLTPWAGAVGNGVDSDSVALARFFSALNQRSRAEFAIATANYKITTTLQVFNKAGCYIDFGNQQINAASFSAVAPGLHFKQNSQAVINNIFLIGDVSKVNTGVLFDAAPGEITIHARVGKVVVSNCDTGIQVGTAVEQFSDSVMDDLYASDCNTGIRLTGENTLAMYYGRVAAYNNAAIGVHFEQGGGTIANLQVAASNYNLYFGATSGLGHSKLNRWDILGGYSEEGVSGEVFINSAACADSDPFREQVVISGFRVTPFTSTGVMDFIQWRLNGDLIIKDTTITHGQQEPRVKVDHNTAYRAPSVLLENCVIDCNPQSAPQVPLSYALTDNRQTVEIDAKVLNGITVWQNNGSINEGVIKRGIYTRKRVHFERALKAIGGLASAWTLADLTSGVCKNSVVTGPTLVLSATPQRRDFWLDDGLMGFYRSGGTTSKTASTTSALFNAGEYSFGCILRCGTSGVDETTYTALGGAGGIRLGVGDTGGAFLRCQVGAFNCQATPSHPFDPHLIIGRYTPGVSVKVDAINLRTGELVSAVVNSAPALVDLTWVNGVSIRNDLTVRGFPFVYKRALSDNEVSSLLQSAMLLTDSWRL